MDTFFRDSPCAEIAWGLQASEEGKEALWHAIREAPALQVDAPHGLSA